MCVEITVFDGAKSIGGTKIHILSDDVGIFLDFGVNYKRWGYYYEEFLRPRTARGIYDLITTGLVPPIKNLYNPTYILPGDFPPTMRAFPYEIKVDAIFVTHAHLDHCGHIGLVRPDIPVYSTTMTAMILKAMRDSGQPEFDKEVAYITPREQDPTDNKKLNPTKDPNTPYIGRSFVVVDKNRLNREVESFWETPPSVGGRARSLRANPLEHRPTVESLNYEAFDVDHSIYGATAYGLETSMGWIAYTGDLRFHGKHGKMTEKFVDFFCRKDCFLLIVEGTNIGDRTRNTEENVFQNCCRETESARGKLVIADFGPRNIERLETFLRIAKETKRQLVICPRDVYILNAMRTVDKKIPLPEREPNVLIYKERKASYKFWEKKIHENYDSRLVTMDEIKNSQGAYILCFSFFDINELTDIKPVEGSIYIYSACEAITEEQEFDFVRLANWLTSLQIAPIGFRIIDVKTEDGEILKRPQFDRRYHSSGHLSEHDIIKIVDEIQPKFLLPVHTEKTEFFKNKFGDIFVEVEEGKPIKIK